MLLTACEQFLGKATIREIEKVALETLEGHQRAIMGSMTVEVNRKLFNIQSSCAKELLKYQVKTN